MKLSVLLDDFYQVKNDCDITGVSLDSRVVKPGDLFIACHGTRLNGEDFIHAAQEKGAAAVITEKEIPQLSKYIGEIAARFYQHPSQKMKMIGITGTNGKTSCSHFLASLLQKNNFSCGVIGTLGNGLYGNLSETNLTTPDAITLQKLLFQFYHQHAKAVAMEVSSHSLEQGRVNGIQFDVAIFTNLTRDHLDYHGSMEAYAKAKQKLFDLNVSKFAVINADDDFGKKLLSQRVQNCFSYGIETKNCDVVASNIQLNLSGIHAKIETPWGAGHLQVPLLGKFNISNLLAVLTAMCHLEIPFSTVLTTLSFLNPVPGRMETYGGGKKPLAVIDYAHTPDALEKALTALRAHCAGKLFCLFGCGGDRDRGKRPLMAAIAEKYADCVMVTDDNPRTENSEKIIADILEGFLNRKNIIVEANRADAIRKILHLAKENDCVLIAGKGAETYQIIGSDKTPFSDKAEVLNYYNMRK